MMIDQSKQIIHSRQDYQMMNPREVLTTEEDHFLVQSEEDISSHDLETGSEQGYDNETSAWSWR